MVENPSDATNWAATVWAAPTTTTTAGDLPLSPIIDTAIKITSDTSAAGEATEYVSYAFTTSAALGVKLKAEFFMRPGTNFIASEWSVSVFAGATRQDLSTDNSTPITFLPNQTGKFTTTFDAVASTAYTLRFARTVNAGANAAVLNIANVIVGPGIQPQGAVVGEWQEFTMTVGAVTTAPTKGTVAFDEARWRRVGSAMEVEWRYRQTVAGTAGTGTYTFSMPSGYTIDTSAVELAQTQTGNLGTFEARSGAITTTAIGTVRARTSTLLEATVQEDDVAAADVSATVQSLANATQKYYFSALVPIAEWAGSGTVNLAQNDVEYAYNSDTSDATNTTAFAYGPEGVFFGSFTLQRGKRVSFQTPIQSTDIITVEINVNSTQPDVWTPHNASVFQYQLQNTTDFGISYTPVAGNQNALTVTFHDYARSNGVLYGAVGEAWSTYTSYKWRVKKAKGGQAVGFGEVAQNSSGLVKSAGQLKSTNTNDDAATGYVGEYVEASIAAGSAISLTTVTAANVTSISLTAGDWDVTAIAAFVTAATTSVTNRLVAISKTSATLPSVNPYASGEVISESRMAADVAGAVQNTRDVPTIRVSLSATTTMYLVVRSSFTVSTQTAHGVLWARRVR